MPISILPLHTFIAHKEKASFPLLKRRGPGCVVKITQRGDGRVEARVKRGSRSAFVELKGIPSRLGEENREKLRKMLEGAYVRFRESCLEVRPRGCGGMMEPEVPNAAKTEEVNFQALIDAISSQTERSCIQDAINILQSNEPPSLSLTLDFPYDDSPAMSHAGALALAAALEKNETLGHLSFGDVEIGHREFRILIDVLKKKSNLHTLDFKALNLIDCMSFSILENFLKENASLQYLLLNTQHQHLGDAGAIALARALQTNQQLRHLHLNSCKIGNVGIQALADALKINNTLSALSLEGNAIDGTGIAMLADALETNTSLRMLHFEDLRNPIGHPNYGALMTIRRCLSRNLIHQIINILQGNDPIQKKTKAAEDIIRQFHYQREYIQINAEEIIKLMETLEEYPPLMELARSKIFLQREEIKALIDALKTNRTLKSLNLSYHKIDDVIATALAEALKNNQSLQRLVLRGNQIGDAGATALAEALKTNQSLQQLLLDSNQIGTAGATALAEALKNNQSLQRLVLRGNQIGDAGATALAEALKINQSLQTLFLGNNQIGDAGATALAEALKINQSLQTLFLGNNQIGDAGATALAEALKINQSLQTLFLGNNQIGAAGATALAEALKINQSLQTLFLGNNQIGAAGATALAEALKINQSLQRLFLGNNQIGDAGATALAEALKNNQSLQQLLLGSNQIGDTGATALAEALKINQSLQRLFLGNNQIGDAGATALAEALKINQSLQQLLLGSNQIGDAGATALAEALKINQSLQQLLLGSNQIGDTGATALAEALKNNQLLQSLALDENQIGDTGATALAEALNTNTTLLTLPIFRNPPLTDHIDSLLQANNQITEMFRDSTRATEEFIQSHQDQTIKEKDAFLSFQEQAQQWHKKIEALIPSLEKIALQSGKTGLNEKHKTNLKGILSDLSNRLHDLLLQVFEDKLACLSKSYFSESSSEDHRISLRHTLCETLTSFFGRECPAWLKTKEKALTTFCLLLNTAEGKTEDTLDPPETLFQRILAGFNHMEESASNL